MRYLKTYRIFEDLSKIPFSKEMLDTLITCDDILHDITDDGFDVRIQSPNQFSVDNTSYITITRTDFKDDSPLKFFAGKFKWLEVKNTLHQMFSMIDDICTYDIEFYDRFIAASSFYRDGTRLPNYHNDKARDVDGLTIENGIVDDTEIGKIRIRLWYHPTEERQYFYKSKLF